MTPETVLLGILNRLLRSDRGARDRLASFAGAVVLVKPGPLPPLRFAINPEGFAEPAPADAPSALQVNLGPAGSKVEGDQALAEAASLFLRRLPWQAEEGLSRFVGDIAARRIAQGAEEFAGWQRDAARRLAGALADFLVAEERMLVDRAALKELAGEVAQLDARIAELEHRMTRLG